MDQFWSVHSAFLRKHSIFLTIAFAFSMLSTVYNLANPLFESPDELFHYRYILALQSDRRLPVVDYNGPLTQYHQPPLYYVLAALVSAPLPRAEYDAYTQPNPFWGYNVREGGRDNKNQYLHPPWSTPANDTARRNVHITRGFSTLLGIVTLWLIYCLARFFFTPSVAAAVAGLAGFIPNFLLTTSSVTNDALTIMLSAAVCLALVSLLGHKHPPDYRVWLNLAVLLSTACLTKLSLWPVLPLSALGVGLLALRLRSWHLFVTAGTLLTVGVLLLFGWWPLRNYLLYGDLTGLAANEAVWGIRGSMTFSEYMAELNGFRSTFWANFGYGNIPMPSFVVTATDLFTAFGLSGLMVGFYRGWRGKDADPALRDRIILLAVYTSLVFLGLIMAMPQQIAVNGRHFYPAIPAVAIGLAAGWRSILPARSERCWAAAVLAAMCIFATSALATVLIPAYASAEKLTQTELGSTDFPVSRLDWQLGDSIVLLGYDLRPTRISPGETLYVTLYWLPKVRPEKNLTIFVSLFGLGGERVGGRNTYPGLGHDPTVYWTPGVVIEDTIPVPIAGDAKGPVLLEIEAGLFDLETGERLLIRDSAGNKLSYPIIGRLKLSQAATPKEQPETEVGSTFAGGLRLDGYSIDELVASAGEQLTVTLFWTASGPLATDYTTFVHVLDRGEIVAQGDRPPLNNRYPTSYWSAGENIVDPYPIDLPLTLGPGRYDLAIGMYDPANGGRLPLLTGADAVMLEGAILIDE